MSRVLSSFVKPLALIHFYYKLRKYALNVVVSQYFNCKGGDDLPNKDYWSLASLRE